MVFGYARVSTQAQSVERQVEALKAHGIDEMFTEKMTGTVAERPELARMLLRARRGDTVVVESFSRLGRSVKNLIDIVEELDRQGIKLVSLRENFDTGTPQGRLMMNVFAAFAQFERDLIVERTKDGLAVARARGRKGGRKPMNEKKVEQAIRLYDTRKFTVDEITRMAGISKTTLYRKLESINEMKGGERRVCEN